MSSKKRTRSHKKSRAKQQPPKPDVDISNQPDLQQTQPGIIIQRARLDPKSLTPQRMLQLQRTIGNRGVGQLLAEINKNQPAQKNRVPAARHISPLGDNQVLQRRVALAKKDEGSPDFIELTSINYAVQQAGGPVELLMQSDFSTMGEGDVLFIVAHGARGSSGDYSADVIVSKLFNDKTGLKNKIKAIKFTSCYAGAGVTDDLQDSVVAKIKNKLDSKGWEGVEVTGARGPSIKSAALGEEFTVLPGKGTPAYKTGGEIQKILMKIHDVKNKVASAISEAEKNQSRALTLEEKAAVASKTSAGFYKDFVDTLQNPKGAAEALKQNQARTPDQELLLEVLEKGPDKLTLEKPMLKLVSQAQKSEGCFISTACVEAKGLPDDCYELQTLRDFRDSYMRALPHGADMIAQYYEIAPGIVAQIKALPDAQDILTGLYQQIVEAVKLIEAKQYQKAVQRYSQIVLNLKARYLDEA